MERVSVMVRRGRGRSREARAAQSGRDGSGGGGVVHAGQRLESTLFVTQRCRQCVSHAVRRTLECRNVSYVDLEHFREVSVPLNAYIPSPLPSTPQLWQGAALGKTGCRYRGASFFSSFFLLCVCWGFGDHLWGKWRVALTNL